MPSEIIEFRADKFQLSKCNARIHTGFCIGEGEGEMCGRRTYEGGGKDGGLNDVLIYLVTNRRIIL